MAKQPAQQSSTPEDGRTTPESTTEKERLILELRRLWQRDPASYWPAFRASKLSPLEVWPEAQIYVEPERLKNVPRKQPGKVVRINIP